MQPESNRGQNRFESGPPPVDYSFETPGLAESPEVYTGGSYERNEVAPSRVELAPQPPVVVAPPVPVGQVAVPQMAPPTPVQLTPQVASDDDVIEVEWVKIAKQVIAQTQDDPRARERALHELQKDYLMKRYGKAVGES